MALECSISRERNRFLKKLKRNPIFLLQHFPSLAAMVLQRYQHQRNHKVFPHWLPVQLEKVNIMPGNDLWQRIPERKLCYSHRKLEPVFSDADAASEQICDNTISDSEDYFAQHRFGELLQFSALSRQTLAPHAHQRVAGLPDSVEQWIKKPPPKSDPAWETYSTCERVANLLTWISFLPATKRNALSWQNIAYFLTESMQWIYDHLEYYRAHTNNHILNNARALIMCGVALNCTSAIMSGLTIFSHTLPILIQPQGALRERSTHYQLIILNWLLDAYFFIQSQPHPSNLPSLAYLKETILRVRAVAAHFCDEDGYLQALIGDISPDSSPQMTVERLRNCYPEYWPQQQTLQPYQHNSRKITTQYDDYYFLNKNQHKIILNCPQKRFPRQHPTHAHNDLTSFVWCYGDQAIFIDSGRARYCKDKISAQQKSAYGHNIAFVDHCSPCSESLVIQGNWWPRPYADADFFVTQHLNHDQSNRLSISHNGFKRATPVKTHTRTLTIDDDNRLHIEDYFAGKPRNKFGVTNNSRREVDIQIFWQLHPSLKIVNYRNNAFINHKMLVEYLTDAENIVVTPQGFCSSQYGEVKKHLILILKWKVQLPFTAKITWKVTPICVA